MYCIRYGRYRDMNRKNALKELKVDFEKSLAVERSNGMVDLKALCDTGRDASSHEFVWTLNNALKQSQKPNLPSYSVDEISAIIK